MNFTFSQKIMFKRINKNAIREAVQSDEALVSQLEECSRYRRAYGFCLLSLGLVLCITLFFGGEANLKPSLVFCILFISISVSAAANNSRSDLLEAIAAQRERGSADNQNGENKLRID